MAEQSTAALVGVLATDDVAAFVDDVDALEDDVDALVVDDVLAAADVEDLEVAALDVADDDLADPCCSTPFVQ